MCIYNIIYVRLWTNLYSGALARVSVRVVSYYTCIFFFLFGFRISHDWNTQVGLRSRRVGRAYKTRGEHRPLTSADHRVTARESELDFISFHTTHNNIIILLLWYFFARVIQSSFTSI